MLEWVIAFAVASTIYPLVVLMVAITGPHNETEKREQLMRRLGRDA